MTESNIFTEISQNGVAVDPAILLKIEQSLGERTMKSIMVDDQLYIPMRAESEDGEVIGDGMVPITKDHPDYEYWLRVAKEEL